MDAGGDGGGEGTGHHPVASTTNDGRLQSLPRGGASETTAIDADHGEGEDRSCGRRRGRTGGVPVGNKKNEDPTGTEYGPCATMPPAGRDDSGDDDAWCSSYVIPEYDRRDDLYRRARSIATALDPHLIPPPGVASLSQRNHRRLLQRYYPKEIVDFFLNRAVPHEELVEALQLVPHLVLEETPLEKFVLYHNESITDGNDSSRRVFVSRQAATKIALHWKLRKYFFGTRAFLPMAMTAAAVRGALSERDMEWYGTGFAAMLPQETDTKTGGYVFTSDRSQFPDHYQPANPQVRGSTKHDNTALRIAFYNMHLNSRYVEPHLPETLVVVAVQERAKPSPYYVSWCHILIEHAFFAKFRENHFLHLPSKQQLMMRNSDPQQQQQPQPQQRKRQHNSPATSFLNFSVHSTKRILQEAGRLMFGYKFSFGYSDQQALHKMCQAKGLNPNCFPTWMGGNWTLQDFRRWQKKQMQTEREWYRPYCHTTNTNKDSTSIKEPIAPSAFVSSSEDEHEQGQEQGQQQQHEQQQHEQHHHYSIIQMQEHVKQLQEDQTHKKQEHNRLSGSLDCARVEASFSLGGGSVIEEGEDDECISSSFRHENDAARLLAESIFSDGERMLDGLHIHDNDENDRNHQATVLSTFLSLEDTAETARSRKKQRALDVQRSPTQEQQRRDHKFDYFDNVVPSPHVSDYDNTYHTEISLCDDLGMFEVRESDFFTNRRMNLTYE